MIRARWVGPGLFAAAALIGPLLTGPASPPTVAAAAAQLLPPGTLVEELPLAGGGFARAVALAPAPAGVRVAKEGEWRTIAAPAAAGPVRRVRLWLGTDHQGRSLGALVVAGARTSLTVALAATLVAVTLGTAVGLAGSLAPALVRAAIEVGTDGLLGLPRLLLLLMLGVALRGSAFGLGLAVGLASWMEISRLVQAEAGRLARTAFVAAAVSTGAGRLAVAVRHVLPHLSPILAVTAPLVATQAIVLEATLSFLGLASGPASWGSIVADGQRLLPAGWWVAFFPGVLLTLTALAVHGLAPARGHVAGT